MTSVGSLLVDAAWAAGLALLVVLLAFQVRAWVRLRREAQRILFDPEIPEPEEEAEMMVGRRSRIRCPRCARAFEILLHAHETSTVVECPTCGLTAPYPARRPAAEPSAGSRPVADAPGT